MHRRANLAQRTETGTPLSARNLVVAAVILAAIACLAYVVLDRSAAKPTAIALRPDDPATLALGERIYADRCASCHGAHLEGQPNWRSRGPDGRLPAPPQDASGHTWHHPDELLFRITKYGVAKAAGLKDYQSTMPVYDGVLSDGEIIAVLSWIKSRWPREVRERHDLINAQSLKMSKP